MSRNVILVLAWSVVSVGAGAQPATCVAGGGGAIPDQGDLVLEIVWPTALVITDVAVTLDLNHPAADDLDVQLLNQATGSRADLWRGVGGAAGGLTGGQSFRIWDGAAQPIGTVLPPSAGSSWTTESGRDLDRLAGEPARGPWVLMISDNRSGSVGSLLGWSLCIDGSSSPLGLGAIVAPPLGSRIVGIVPADFQAGFTAPDQLHFSLNSDAGSTAYNSAVPGSVAAGASSTFVGAVAWAPGFLDNAVQLGGVAYLPTMHPLAPSQPFTVRVYVQVNAGGVALRPILSDPGAAGFEVAIGGAAGNLLAVRGGGLSRELRSVTDLTVPGIWRQIAVAGDGAGGIRLFVDGALEDSLTGQSLAGVGTGIVLGRDAAGATSFDGLLDEFELWGITPVDAFFEYSLDGLTFFTATAGGGAANPLVGIPATPAPRTFEWDTIADGVGTPQPQLADLQITITSAGVPGIIEAAEGWVVDNVDQCRDAASLPLPITNLAPASALLTFPRGLTIDDLILTLDLGHPDMGELNLTLTSPGGTTVPLFAGQGVGETLIAGERWHLWDGSPNPWGLHLPPRTGLAYTTQTLSLGAFDGEDAQGTWTLEVTDTAAGNDGTLAGFSLCFIGTPTARIEVIAPAPGARGVELGATDEVALAFTAVALTQPSQIDAVTVASTGTADDARDIGRVRLLLDADASGTVTPGDTQLATAPAGFAVDEGAVILSLGVPLPLAAGVVTSLLVVEDFTVAGVPGTTCAATLTALTPGAMALPVTGLPLAGDLLTLQLPSVGLVASSGPLSLEVVAAGTVDVPVLPFTLTSIGAGAIDVGSILLTAGGSGDDSAHLTDVRLYDDADASSTVTAGDVLLVQAGASYPADNGVLVLAPPSLVVPGGGGARTLLVTYDIAPGAPSGATFEANLDAVTVATPAGAPVLGLPLASNLVAIDVSPAPGCSIVQPTAGATVGGDVAIDLDVTTVTGAPVTTTFELSTDGGITWTPATPAVASVMGNPDLARPAPFSSSFTWDSYVDAIGRTGVQAFDLRVTVRDDPRFAGGCSVSLLADNTRQCTGTCGDCNLSATGPDILDALAASQIAVGLLVPSTPQRGCCDVDSDSDVDVLDALRIAQVAAGLPVVLTCL